MSVSLARTISNAPLILLAELQALPRLFRSVCVVGKLSCEQRKVKRSSAVRWWRGALILGQIISAALIFSLLRQEPQA